MDQTTNINQATPIKPQKTNLPLIITLVCLFVVIIVLIVVIIIINNQPTSTGETPTKAELEEIANNLDTPSKETSTLDCTRPMSAAELTELEAVSGQVEIVADFEADESLGRISIYKTIIGPSTDAENPDAPGDEFLVENTTNTGDELNSTNLPTYYLNENTTTKNTAKTSWQSQGFTCLDQ